MSLENKPSFMGNMIRHINDGDIDIATIQRGAKQLVRQIATAHSEEASLAGPTVLNDFLSHEGLTMASYQLAGFFPLWARHAMDIRLFMFPESFRLNVHMADHPTDTEKFLITHPQAVAAFHGPTYSDRNETIRAVNNGFYYKGAVQVPFMETDPPGERRGAIILHENGDVELADDRRKWDALSNPSGIQTISGTSDFIRSTDTVVELKRDKRPRHATSFLIQGTAGKRIMYCPLYSPISRPTVLRLLQTFEADFGLGECIGVELEYNGATNYIKEGGNPNTIYAYPGHVSYKRLDHYYFTKNEYT
ncbi:MAG: hypothetical protein NUV52_03330 [Candidatus Roizmanbacteria bacterium]|nr:hypothetical protein [Candidatus Roizmanbacteria bacterium]